MDRESRAIPTIAEQRSGHSHLVTEVFEEYFQRSLSRNVRKDSRISLCMGTRICTKPGIRCHHRSVLRAYNYKKYNYYC